jgi:hypothetical protein
MADPPNRPWRLGLVGSMVAKTRAATGASDSLRTPPLPSAFRASESLRWLDVVAVGFTLAACSSVLWELGGIGLEVPLSTLFYGLVWASLLRIVPRLGSLAWLASLPLAAMNAGTACTLNELHSPADMSPDVLLKCFFLGASFGVLIWLPSLIVTLLFFGIPLSSAQRAARRGITGSDRGSVIVGVASATYSALVLVVCAFRGEGPGGGDGIWPFVRRVPLLELLHQQGYIFWRFVGALAVAGLAAGASAAAIVLARGQARAAFLARVRSGDAAGYRIEPRTAAPPRPRAVLVRVTEAEDYRVTERVEPLFELDERGDPARAREGAPS